MSLVPLTPFRASTNRAWLLEEAGDRRLVKGYEGERARQRRDCEARRLALWARHGFRVPQVVEHAIEELSSSVYLVMEYVPAPTLQEVLKDGVISRERRFEWLTGVLSSNRRRHELVFRLHEPDLLHHDPNTSNILCPAGRDCCFIDFEGEVKSWEPEFIGMEIAKLFRWTARDLGRAELDQAAQHLLHAYAGREEWLKSIIHRTRRRPFQFFHRWQDARRKAAKPEDITKYDVADTLARLLS